VTGFFSPEVSRQIKKFALDQDKTMQDLLQEALNDLFRKYDLPPIA
jgi:mRNA-degrading endonuclease RelE of RelBE toxin-antitoxin system